jgi:hypothetical protein
VIVTNPIDERRTQDSSANERRAENFVRARAPAGRTRTALAVISHGILARTVLSLVLFATVDAGGI